MSDTPESKSARKVAESLMAELLGVEPHELQATADRLLTEGIEKLDGASQEALRRVEQASVEIKKMVELAKQRLAKRTAK